jgi:hypothetical protein
MMDDPQKSDDSVVPAKPPNNDAHASAEVVEGRGSAKGNTREQNATRDTLVLAALKLLLERGAAMNLVGTRRR